jgi:hypothetical protein
VVGVSAPDYEFRIGEIFPAADPVARFVVVLAMIYSDWFGADLQLSVAWAAALCVDVVVSTQTERNEGHAEQRRARGKLRVVGK